VKYIAPIVEGHGELEALPALLHRIASGTGKTLLVNRPIRVKAAKFINDEEDFRRHIELAAAKAIQNGGFVLVLLDCEDDCAAEMGPQLLQRASAVRPDARFIIVLATKEYESWFLAGAKSLRGLRGLPENLEPPAGADAIRNAKGWLSQRMNVAYDEITHQLEFTRKMDLDQACDNRSFRRFRNRIAEILLAQT
jgi:hypothetical protein